MTNTSIHEVRRVNTAKNYEQYSAENRLREYSDANTLNNENEVVIDRSESEEPSLNLKA